MYDPSDAVRFIAAHSLFLVLGHKEPDGDCIASQITFGSLLKALGKTVRLYSVGPFDRPEITPFQAEFADSIRAEERVGGAVVILDCSTPDRTGRLGSEAEGLPTLVIDHHSAGEVFGDARMVDSSSPSTTMLVQALYEALGVAPDAETCRLLLFGLCTDTGFFRHLGRGSQEIYRAVARLVERGTSTADVYMMVYGRRELASRKLLGEMLGRAESYADGRLILTWQTTADRQRLHAQQRGEDDLYRLLQTVKDNVVVAAIKQEAEDLYSVGLRSTAAVDVGTVASSFGGGGHRQAAGFDIHGTLESVKERVVHALLPLVSGSS